MVKEDVQRKAKAIAWEMHYRGQAPCLAREAVEAKNLPFSTAELEELIKTVEKESNRLQRY